MTQGDDRTPGAAGDELASYGQRAGARVIDWILLFVSSFVIILPFSDRRIGYLVWMLVIALYETVPVAKYGKTIGKAVVNIKIVDAKTGMLVAPLRAFLRVAPVLAIVAIVPGQFFPAVLVFLYFTAAFGAAHNRGLIDRLAGTAVVKDFIDS